MRANEVLNAIKDFYGYRTDKALAQHLGVPGATLGAWRHRDYFDISIIIVKCADINLEELLRNLKAIPSSSLVVKSVENTVAEPKTNYGQDVIEENQKLKAENQKLRGIIIQLADKP